MKLGRYASLRSPFMDLSKHPGVGTFDLMKRSKNLISLDVKRILVFTRSLVGVR
jgi:hypothetical protein